MKIPAGGENNAGSVERSGVMEKELEKNIYPGKGEKGRCLWRRLYRVGWLHDERLIFLQVEGVKVVYVELEFWIL